MANFCIAVLTQIAQRAFNTPLMVDPAKALAFLSGLGPRGASRHGGQPAGRKHDACACPLGSREFFDKLIAHPKTEEAYKFYAATGAQPLRQDVRRNFPFAGIVFEEYAGTVTLSTNPGRSHAVGRGPPTDAA